MQLITNSRLSSFRRCRRLHYFGYELLRRPRKISEALGFGTLFHVALEQWWLWHEAGSPREGDPLEAALGAIMAKFAAVAEEAELNPYDLVKAEELMRGYHFRWRDTMVGYEVLGVESQFKIRLVNPLTGRPSPLWILSGKLDARVRVLDPDSVLFGKVLVVEHKTSTADVTPGSPYWNRLQMDGQISTYMDGSTSLPGGKPAGCLYDVSKRPGLRPKAATPEEDIQYTQDKPARPGVPCKLCKAVQAAAAKESGVKLLVKDMKIDPGCEECKPPRDAEPSRLYSGQRLEPETPEEYRQRVREDISADPNGYFQRGDVVRLEEDLDEYRYDTWETAKELRLRQLAGNKLGIKAWPRDPGACERYGGFCDYYDVCTNRASIDDDMLFRTAEKQHEELDDSVQAPESDEDDGLTSNEEE